MLKFSQFAASAIVATFASVAVAADEIKWPTQPITLIAPSSPGSPMDSLARAIEPALARQLGVSVVIENKPGASGKIGMQALLRANPDGHTFSVATQTHLTALPVFDPNVGFKVPDDFGLLSLAIRTPSATSVHTQVPVRSMQEFVDYARANPGKLNYGSFGVRSSGHLAAERLWNLLGIHLNHVPYKSESEGLHGLASGQIDVMNSSGAVRPHQETGKVVTLGTSGPERWDIFPNIPTMQESGVSELKNYVYLPWLGFATSSRVPAEIQKKLSDAIREALRSPEAQRLLNQQLGYIIVASSPEEMAAAVQEDLQVYRELKASGRIPEE